MKKPLPKVIGHRRDSAKIVEIRFSMPRFNPHHGEVLWSGPKGAIVANEDGSVWFFDDQGRARQVSFL